MNITLHLTLVAVAACLCLADGAPDGRLIRTKQQRPTRGFKNVEMMTARGFGKRARPSARTEQQGLVKTRREFNPKSSLMVGLDYGKRSGTDDSDEGYGLDNFWESLELTPEGREGLESDEKTTLESIPLDWFVNEMVNNPDFARSIVRKFIDVNQDGVLTPEELLRNVYV